MARKRSSRVSLRPCARMHCFNAYMVRVVAGREVGARVVTGGWVVEVEGWAAKGVGMGWAEDLRTQYGAHSYIRETSVTDLNWL